MAQMEAAAPVLEPFLLNGMTENRKSYFQVEFDPATLALNRRFRPLPVTKPALPDDLSVRVTAARQLLDPRAPMMSLLTVLETILQVEDPAGEIDRIWEDMAQRDPVLMPEQIAQALERLGEPEMAARMREVEMQAAIIEEMKLRQLAGNTQQSEEGNVNPAPQDGSGNPKLSRRDGSSEQLPDGFEPLGTDQGATVT